MKNTAIIHDDGSLTIAAEVLLEAGFLPGERVELAQSGETLVLVPAHNWDRVFAKWGAFDAAVRR